jgi:hypothetical protein
VKFPKTVRFRKAEVKIYGPSEISSFYRVCAYVAGKRRMSSHGTYTEASQAAGKLSRIHVLARPPVGIKPLFDTAVIRGSAWIALASVSPRRPRPGPAI